MPSTQAAWVLGSQFQPEGSIRIQKWLPSLRTSSRQRRFPYRITCSPTVPNSPLRGSGSEGRGNRYYCKSNNSDRKRLERQAATAGCLMKRNDCFLSSLSTAGTFLPPRLGGSRGNSSTLLGEDDGQGDGSGRLQVRRVQMQKQQPCDQRPLVL